MTRARDLGNLGDNTSKLEQQGLVQVIASSVTKGASGSASVDSKGTVTFTGTESVSLNDVFSSTYDNYRILIDGVNSTTSARELILRMRASTGSDNSSSNYRWSQTYVPDNSASPTNAGAGSNGTTTSFNLAGLSSTAGYYSPVSVELKNPFSSTKHTSFNFQDYYYDQFGTVGYSYAGSGAMTVTTSYTGFTIIISSGNMTGTVRVYGYNQ